MAEMTSSPPHRRSPSVKKQIPERAARPLRILLAEDNKVNQQYASVILASAGHSVELAANGRLAVDALGRADFDVVLMDIQMPELDGVEATRQIRALPGPRGRNISPQAWTITFRSPSSPHLRWALSRRARM